jgi:hypothetical protein
LIDHPNSLDFLGVQMGMSISARWSVSDDDHVFQTGFSSLWSSPPKGPLPRAAAPRARETSRHGAESLAKEIQRNRLVRIDKCNVEPLAIIYH